MATISLCMIVKNEEKLLARCLDSVADLMDEIIIVDTGSTDQTKAVARKYTDKVYDFEWVDDFSVARNYSFSKATMDYIYTADADEVLDETNREGFAKLKEIIVPEVEIVQMKYKTIAYDTVLNAVTEYRPKLYKRLREFTWIDPIHETVRLDPVVFDSDIVIEHRPEGLHASRDFRIFEKQLEAGNFLSDKLLKMYAKELVKNGEKKDLEQASKYFERIYNNDSKEINRVYASCVLAKYYSISNDDYNLMKLVLKVENKTSEISYELASYYMDKGDALEASIWYFEAYQESEAELDIHRGGDLALQGLIRAYTQLFEEAVSAEEKEFYKTQIANAKTVLSEWHLPEEG